MNPMSLFLATSAVALLAACGSKGPSMSGSAASVQSMVPDAVKVPPGQKVAMETVGIGEITYECREKQAAAGQFEWVFVGPDAALKDRSGRTVGRYYGPPATWESSDQSKVTGTQLAVAPGGAGNIALQLVKANPAVGQGSMTGVSYIQRLATRGGVAPAMACGMEAKGQRQIVKYQADYIFWSTM